MGKNSDMVGKIPPWKWEKGRKKKSDMVVKIPTWSEKNMGRGTYICRHK
jgi:hypothetical protein